MEGTVIGGNLPSFRLLYGTQYIPSISNSVIFIEWDNYTNSDLLEFDRELEALTMQNGFESVQGLIIERFQEGSNVSKEDLIKIISSKPKLKNIPVLANVDFGHTAPMFVFPIGGYVKVDKDQTNLRFKI